MIKINPLVFIFIFSFAIFSCGTKKNTVYLQKNNSESQKSQDYMHAIINKNDILNISVSALDMTSIAAFMKENIVSNSMDKTLIEGYQVGENGFINLPLIGKINVLGKTTKQASKDIEYELSKSVIDPIVNIRILNYKITILGEVNNPNTFFIYDPKINLLQALGLAGDITIYGNKKKIKLVREVNGESIIKKLDITKTDFMQSEYFYLKNNDVIYVEPTFAKIKNSGYIGQISNITTVFSLIISIILLSRN